MARVRTFTEWTATGQRRFRQSMLGTFILQVEESRKEGSYDEYGYSSNVNWTKNQTRWRDAKAADLIPCFNGFGSAELALDDKSKGKTA